MRLYHHPFSFNARRAVMTAFELEAVAGAPKVELALVDLKAGQQQSPEFKRVNPMGKVPALDDDGFFLSESHAIMQYLCDKTPGQTLYPTDVKARADVNRWLFWSAHHWAPSVTVLNWEHVVKGLIGQGPADPREIARGERLVTQHAGDLDRHLEGKAWLAEDRLTLADLAVASPLMALEAAKLPVAPFKNVARWFAKVRERDSWKRASG